MEGSGLCVSICTFVTDCLRVEVDGAAEVGVGFCYVAMMLQQQHPSVVDVLYYIYYILMYVYVYVYTDYVL